MPLAWRTRHHRNLLCHKNRGVLSDFRTFSKEVWIKTQLAVSTGCTGIYRRCWHLRYLHFFLTLRVCFRTLRNRVLLGHDMVVRWSILGRGATLQERTDSTELGLALLVTTYRDKSENPQGQKTHLFSDEILWFLYSAVQSLHPFLPSLWRMQYRAKCKLCA